MEKQLNNKIINVTGADGIYYILNEGKDNQIDYYSAETTAPGWKLGEVPDLDSTSAYVCLLYTSPSPRD